jgi:hypothetical protein
MPIPLYKLFSLATKVYLKPILNYVKEAHVWNFRNVTGFNARMVRLGNWKNRLDLRLNFRVLGIKTDLGVVLKPLPANIALEKGIEVFYELIFFAIIILVVGSEMLKSQINMNNRKMRNHAQIAEVELYIVETQERVYEIGKIKKQVYEDLDSRLVSFKNTLETVIEKTSKASEAELDASEKAIEFAALQSSIKERMKRLAT